MPGDRCSGWGIAGRGCGSRGGRTGGCGTDLEDPPRRSHDLLPFAMRWRRHRRTSAPTPASRTSMLADSGTRPCGSNSMSPTSWAINPDRANDNFRRMQTACQGCADAARPAHSHTALPRIDLRSARSGSPATGRARLSAGCCRSSTPRPARPLPPRRNYRGWRHLAHVASRQHDPRLHQHGNRSVVGLSRAARLSFCQRSSLSGTRPAHGARGPG